MSDCLYVFFSASYDTVVAAIKDPLVLAKLQFYAAIARTFNPFLKKYQTDEPVLPFLPKGPDRVDDGNNLLNVITPDWAQLIHYDKMGFVVRMCKK